MIIASALVETIAGQSQAGADRRIDAAKVANLVGKRYLPPFDYYYRTLGDTTAELRTGGRQHVAWRVVAADFVTIDSGTGVVHQAPAFGEVDYEVSPPSKRALSMTKGRN